MSLANGNSVFSDSLSAFVESQVLSEASETIPGSHSPPAASPYQNNYIGAHKYALKNIYPAVHHCLGETIFFALGKAYIDNYPPKNWDINLYGEVFFELIAAQEKGKKGNEFAWQSLARLAKLEYSITQLYYMPDDSTPRKTKYVDEINTDIINIKTLQSLHPYCNFTANLNLNLPMFAWRENAKIQIQNKSVKQMRSRP